uniref:Putative PSD protein n=1 Tax=Hordeum vulgare subsp. vulgare TaxID=112509 RepID=A0A023INH5_HORVV|nr:putative PSD protein [Hordeum vulgare subsp. vulgare]
MRNPRDPKTKVLPSTTRTRKELPSSFALDSPSVMSKFATPPPTRNSDVSPLLDDATSAIHDAYDDALLDTALPLGAFLDAQIARVAAECDDTSETAEIIEVEPVVSPVRTSSPRYELPDIPEAEILLNNILSNDNAWTIPEPPPKPTPKKRGILFLSPEDMQEAKKSMQEKGIKSKDVKNLPPIEEIHGLDNPTQVVEVNSLLRFNDSDIPFDKPDSLCLDEFDNFVAKQQSFNDYVSRQLRQNARMIDHISACMDRNVNDLKFLSKHASMVTTQVQQVLKAQNDLLNELNDKSVRVVTRGGRMTQEPLYPEGHPKRI